MDRGGREARSANGLGSSRNQSSTTLAERPPCLGDASEGQASKGQGTRAGQVGQNLRAA